MSRLHFVLILILISFSGCSGRAPVAPGEIPRGDYVTAEDEEYGQQVLATLTNQYQLERDDYAVNRVRDIVDRLARAAGAAGDPWNVYVLHGERTVNAAATRGHYVFVWTGMLSTVRNDGELAAVLAHEIGHVLAGHTSPTPGEESAEIISRVGGNVANRIVSVQGPYGSLGSLAGLLAEQAIRAFIVNPELQRKEFEADQIGLFLMADAGYDPQDAVSLWDVMSSQSDTTSGVPTFLSSHPANDERLEEIRKLLPAADERYRVALSLAKTKKGSKQKGHQNDSFAVGRPSSAKPKEWFAIEDGTTIFAEPSTRSRQLLRLRRNEPLSIRKQGGEWCEVSEPVHGYVLAPEIYSTPGR